MPPPDRRRARLDAGLCASCGTARPAPGHCSCPACLAGQRAAEAARRAALRRDRICLDCRSAPADPPHYRCAACRQRQAARVRAASDAPP